MSYFNDDSSEDDYEHYEEECEWYEEEFPSCSTCYKFIRDEGYLMTLFIVSVYVPNHFRLLL